MNSTLNFLAYHEPNTEGYWYYWQWILDNVTLTGKQDDGILYNYSLWQDGDLWLLDWEKMTDEERQNFGFDVD